MQVLMKSDLYVLWHTDGLIRAVKIWETTFLIIQVINNIPVQRRSRLTLEKGRVFGFQRIERVGRSKLILCSKEKVLSRSAVGRL